MPKAKATPKPVAKTVEDLKHKDDKRKNIPSAEYQSVAPKESQAPRIVRYPRNTDLDPQLVWRGKDEQDSRDLEVPSLPLYIQEKIHPKALIDDLMRHGRATGGDALGQLDLFGDFNGIPDGADKTEFYQHDQNWSNRMILGDSLQVMTSLAEREGLRGKVQCIYIDPPYGIKFNSNFQWSTTNRNVKDGSASHISREAEQVKAFRDTWRDGIHSYLSYVRDRILVSHDLLSDQGSLFVQIGDENVHRVRSVLDEVFGERNFVSINTVRKTTSDSTELIGSTCDFVLWYAKRREVAKAHTIWATRGEGAEERYSGEYGDGRLFQLDNITSSRPAGNGDLKVFSLNGQVHNPGSGTFKSTETGLSRLAKGDRLAATGRGKLRYRRFHNDFGFTPISNLWTDVSGAVQSRSDPKVYVVQTSTTIVERCLLLTTDPGDLVLDPTCGSGTTAHVAEQLGRRWITIDTSRVALALARARIMGAKYPFYLLADSHDGQRKEAEISGKPPFEKPSHSNVRQGFVYERVPHITLKSIANNTEVDIIWENRQPQVLAALADLNAELRGHKKPYRIASGGREGKDIRFNAPSDTTFTMPSGEVVPAHSLVEWEVPREAPADWPEAAKAPLAAFWEARIRRQKEIDDSIARKAEYEYLYDRPYEDKKKVRVAGPFTVESLSPHRTLGVDENDNLIDPFKKVGEGGATYDAPPSFEQIILDNLKAAGVQQAHKEDRITFTSLVPWPGSLICAEGKYLEGETERRAGIFIGPEFGTVTRPDLVEAAKEAGDSGFDVLITCAFNYEARTTEFSKLGRLPVLKARMNADLHMGGELKNTGKGNLFVIFGEPDIDLLHDPDGQVRVKIKGVDVFDPSTGEVRSDGADGIACWFVDTDYNEESFFVRHAYFLGANDPYKALRNTLKAEIDEEAWETLHSDTSRLFEKPSTGRIAVKVINHLGDEVMKVFRVS